MKRAYVRTQSVRPVNVNLKLKYFYESLPQFSFIRTYVHSADEADDDDDIDGVINSLFLYVEKKKIIIAFKRQNQFVC